MVIKLKASNKTNEYRLRPNLKRSTKLHGVEPGRSSGSTGRTAEHISSKHRHRKSAGKRLRQEVERQNKTNEDETYKIKQESSKLKTTKAYDLKESVFNELGMRFDK